MRILNRVILTLLLTISTISGASSASERGGEVENRPALRFFELCQRVSSGWIGLSFDGFDAKTLCYSEERPSYYFVIGSADTWPRPPQNDFAFTVKLSKNTCTILDQFAESEKLTSRSYFSARYKSGDLEFHPDGQRAKLIEVKTGRSENLFCKDVTSD